MSSLAPKPDLSGERLRSKVDTPDAGGDVAISHVETHDEAPSVSRGFSRLAVVESVFITLAIPAIGYATDAHDPFFLGHRFSWLVFVPILIGLRHGSVLGLGSAALLDAVLLVAW